jgi:hypothetical protein
MLVAVDLHELARTVAVMARLAGCGKSRDLEKTVAKEAPG